jgi:hypothetical protein
MRERELEASNGWASGTASSDAVAADLDGERSGAADAESERSAERAAGQQEPQDAQDPDLLIWLLQDKVQRLQQQIAELLAHVIELDYRLVLPMKVQKLQQQGCV